MNCARCRFPFLFRTLVSLLISAVLTRSTAEAQLVSSYGSQDQFRLRIERTKETIKLDGELTEAVWQRAPKTTPFILKYPNDKERPGRQTEGRVTYDDKFFYVAFTSWDTSYAIVQSLKRDIGHLDNDGVGISLDPMNLHSTGFIFFVNAYNAQSEDQISPGLTDDIKWNWNNKWFSATQRYHDRWTAEIAIPFKTLRYPPGQKEWGVNFMRVDMKNNHYSVWAHVPVNFKMYDLGYTGTLEWDSLPPSPGKNVVMIPYATGATEQDRENGNPVTFRGNAGLDAKLTLNSSLNLDLTLNPDFSQVEVDKQVTNLTRFNLFFPERRSFFLENADIIGEYGIPGLIQPFYSRTIGLDKNGNRIPIIGGARLSGSVSPTTRIGVMSIQTGAKEETPAQNYSAVSVNQNVFGRSIVKGYFFNHEGFLSADQRKKEPLDAWGRNAGLTFDYISKSGKWLGWSAYHHSFKEGLQHENKYLETGFSYSTNRFTHVLDLTSVGTNYYTDMGFVQRINNYDALRDTTLRLGFKHIFEEVTFKWFPLKGRINRHTLSFMNYFVFNPDYTFNEANINAKYKLEWENTSQVMAGIGYNQVNLQFPISFTDGTPLPKGHYEYNQLSVEYFSDTRKLFSYSAAGTIGSFYNGQLRSLAAGVILRSRPHVNVELRGEFNRIVLPFPYGSTTLFLISPRVEVNFSTAVSWTTFLQFNTQQNNFNVNSRFQYRFKPMSDLYLVYTDNYFTDPLLKNKNRGIVFKLNYWLNL